MDVRQGKLNDCWLLSAIASLSLHRPLLEKVVPLNQSFQDGYNGCFTFQFWQYGQWVDVRIDDLLPTQGGQLIYLNSPEKYEFWSSLLEKAYAKLKGGYRALDMGFPHEAMVDMTGGVSEVLNVASLPRELPAFLTQLLAKGALINCANCQGPLEQRNELGIMFRHAYSLTAVNKVKTKHGTVDLVRILNPWGNTEWEGPWSDFRGPEWNSVSVEEQQRLDRVNKEDGEFWMSVPDFRQNFEVMEVCHMTESLCQPGPNVQPWSCVVHHGNWVPRISNPQFFFPLSKEDDKSEDSERSCSFLVALMQKHHRRRGIDLAIALHIYPAPPDLQHLTSSHMSSLRPVLCSAYTTRREVVLRSRLPPGRYIIIPSTYEPNQEGAFLVRVLTEKGNAAPSYPHLAALPNLKSTHRLFNKHCGQVSPARTRLHTHSLIICLCSSVLAGSEKMLSLEQCKSLVVLMDSQGLAQLSWQEFKGLWDKIRRWTVISSTFSVTNMHPLFLFASGIVVDDFIMQLIGLRYTEPDLTISYPGFLYLLMKLDTMIRNGGGDWEGGRGG
uniref:Zgc:85932 n=1 Tax=Myripristis murdjan TaxID=586833 RepID=A0A667X5T5_9TELE